MYAATAIWLMFSVHSYGGVTAIAQFRTQDACLSAVTSIKDATRAGKDQGVAPRLYCAPIASEEDKG